MGIITEDIEKMFLMKNGIHVDDPKIYDEMISDINSEKWLVLDF